MQKKVELISLGDELLIGLRENAHLVTIGDRLNRFGLPLTLACEINDTGPDIEMALRQAWERSDLIITTGGLGPTADDMTVEFAASALNVGTYFDSRAEADLRRRFKERGLTPTENNFKQCVLLEGAEMLVNGNGTAPGQWFERDGKVLVMLPGPGSEMRPMFEHQVLPKLVEKGWALEREAYLQLRTMGEGESKVATLIEPILDPLRHQIRVAYCAHNGFVDVRLSNPSGELVGSQLRQIGEQCKEVLGDGFVAYGSPSVACLILQQLKNLGRTLAVAESCSGGLLADCFTNVSGASKVFKGGIVSYTNDVKENLLNVPPCLLKQHGAVSAECAIAMATGVAEALEADYALSITGYAGPEGGKEPVGTVYLGFHSPCGVWSKKVHLPGSREMVKQRAVNHSIDFMRRKLKKYEVQDLLECMGNW